MKATVYRLATGTALALTLTACSGKGHETVNKQAEPAAVVTGITLETVKSGNMAETREVAGTVRARTSAVVSTRIPGTVSVLRVREGDRVRKGQLLAQLDARENQAAAAASSAGVDEARQGVDEAQTRQRLAETTFERYQKLFREQAVTRQEFDVKQSERDLAIQGVSRAKARLRQAQENAHAAGAMADYTRIVAPISGIITSKQVDLGATVFPSQPLMTVEGEGDYQLDLAIPESMATSIKPGTPVQVTLDAAGAAFSAKIAEIVPSADQTSRTFSAKVNLDRKGLKSGMFGRAALPLGTSVDGILLDRKALVERGSLTSVWTVDKDNTARMRLVKAGRFIGEKVEILSGLSDGDQVVTGGAEKLNEGSRVK